MQSRFLFGAARSGTNALTWALEKNGALSVFNENDDRCFIQFLLMDETILDSLISQREGKICFFKCFHDTPRAQVLLNRYEAKAVYSIRSPRDCIGSFVHAWGEVGANLWLKRFEEASHGYGFALQMCRGDRGSWNVAVERAQFVLNLLSEASRTPANIAGCYYLWSHSFSEHIDLFVDSRFEIIDYDELIADPQTHLDRVCDHFKVQRIHASVLEWSQGRNLGRSISLDPKIEEQCQELYHRIAKAERKIS